MVHRGGGGVPSLPLASRNQQHPSHIRLARAVQAPSHLSRLSGDSVQLPSSFASRAATRDPLLTGVLRSSRRPGNPNSARQREDHAPFSRLSCPPPACRAAGIETLPCHACHPRGPSAHPARHPRVRAPLIGTLASNARLVTSLRARSTSDDQSSRLAMHAQQRMAVVYPATRRQRPGRG
ncbi:hypothetical protein OH76DRAFT_656297 [Lentinus brumalis]|uniref:Uncharacterized protein n=1 Tax=Lentinus brumalis TaxID=2498619 RepID=A0A371D7F2_9APHY|nr:hypothetical protein OH76DRAFT_656297 [Polyporus brumalis]